MAQFIAFLFNMVTTFIGCLLVLRAFIFYQRLSIFDPVARLAWFGTNWLVEPLSQFLKPSRRYEWASIVGALIMAIVVCIVNRQVTGLPFAWYALTVCAIFVLIRWVLELILWGTIIYVLLSWLQPTSPAYAMVWRLMNPILGPLSSRLPKIANIDISPLIVFFIVNALLYWVTPISQGYFVTAWLQ